MAIKVSTLLAHNTDVVLDTSPSLGGPLNTNGFPIANSGSPVVISGNGYPITTGTAGQVLTTNGAGAGEVTCWTYGGATMVASANGVMTPYNNTWVMITYTYDGTNHRVYRNETLLNSATTAQNPGTFTQIYINGYPPTGTTSETATYQVDSYNYYGRTLTQPEIQTIYESRGNRHAITYNQIAAYDFDELSQGSTVTGVIDISGNGNTMINTGAGTAITYTYTGTVSSSNLRPVQ